MVTVTAPRIEMSYAQIVDLPNYKAIPALNTKREELESAVYANAPENRKCMMDNRRVLFRELSGSKQLSNLYLDEVADEYLEIMLATQKKEAKRK